MPTILILGIILVIIVVGGIYWAMTKSSGNSGGEVHTQSLDKEKEEGRSRS